MKRIRPIWALVLVACFLCSCPSLGVSGVGPRPAYVQADRDTFNALAPVIRLLADNDPSNDPDLTGINGVGLIQTINTWELRIEAAEGRNNEQ